MKSPKETNSKDDSNKRRGLFISIGLHALLLLLAILPLMSYPDPPPEKEGILINFGLPDEGRGNELPQTHKANTEMSESQPPAEQKEAVKKDRKESKAEKQKPKQKLLTDETSDIKKQQAEKSRKQSEAEKKAKEEARKMAEKAAEQARKQEEYQKSKSQFKQAFDGSGKGNTSTPGSQGTLNGDPNSSLLEGISTGKGKIGGGLSDRGVLYEPIIKDQSQKTGRVVMKVCVDRNGKVTSADYTQRGSTTTDIELKKIAVNAAKKFKFTPGELDSQCGTITIDFKVQ